MALNAALGTCGVWAPARPAHDVAPVMSRGGQASSFCGPSLRCRMRGLPAFAVGRQAAGPVHRRHRRAAMPVRSEVSYIMIKPDGVQRSLVGEIIGRLERKGFTLRALRLRSVPRQLAEEHYKDLRERPFFPDLVDYITSGPVVAMVWEGKGVVNSARKLIGATNPLEAEPGTIRGDLAVQTGRNVVHGSDSCENGERETGAPALR